MYWDQLLEQVRAKSCHQEALIYASNIEAVCQRQESIDLRRRENRPMKQYRLGGEFGQLCLTFREAQCTYFFIKGHTMRAIAERLGLSARTVEFYLENIKTKLNCVNKSDLISRVLESDFMKNVDKDIKSV